MAAADEMRRLRRFNRLLAQRIGLLDERYLDTPLPYSQARLLYEVTALAPLATHHLRRLLAFDAGALSRGLSGLERRRYVRRTVDPRDARNRIVEVTKRGYALLEKLDRRSDARAGSMVAAIAPRDRRRLLDALDESRRLLVAAVARIEARAARHPDVRATQAAYLGEMARRLGKPLDTWNQGPLDDAASFVVLDGRRPFGCGALRELSPGVGEIKRMWLHPDARGLGLGTRLLEVLEAAARRTRQKEIRLDTNRHLREAMALYEAAGYRRIPRYNDNPDATHFYAKVLRHDAGRLTRSTQRDADS